MITPRTTSTTIGTEFIVEKHIFKLLFFFEVIRHIHFIFIVSHWILICGRNFGLSFIVPFPLHI
jgi:hypothetical protein